MAVLLLTMSGSTLAQDYIRTKDGRRRAVVIENISESQVSYRDYYAPDGPLYTLPIEDIDQIDFSKMSAGPVYDPETAVVDARAVSNHSFSWSPFLGLEYSYEGAVSDHWTLIGRVGITPTGMYAWSGEESTHIEFLHFPAVTFEPRWYFSLEDRARDGKRTTGNSANFLSLRNSLLFTVDGPVIRMIPMFGIRRTAGRSFFHEFTVGPTAYFGPDGTAGASIHVNYRLGWYF